VEQRRERRAVESDEREQESGRAFAQPASQGSEGLRRAARASNYRRAKYRVHSLSMSLSAAW
jgi:hypothetical protein